MVSGHRLVKSISISRATRANSQGHKAFRQARQSPLVRAENRSKEPDTPPQAWRRRMNQSAAFCCRWAIALQLGKKVRSCSWRLGKDGIKSEALQGSDRRLRAFRASASSCLRSPATRRPQMAVDPLVPWGPQSEGTRSSASRHAHRSARPVELRRNDRPPSPMAPRSGNQ